MKPSPTRGRANPLLSWQRTVVLVAAAALLVTGVAWLPFHYLWGAGTGELPHPLEAWLMRAHGLTAPLGLFAAGVVASSHVSRGWRLRQRRRTGLGLALLGGMVIVSGYALAYLVPESWHAAVGWGHTGLGVVAFGLGLVHRRLGRRARAEMQHASSSHADPQPRRA